MISLMGMHAAHRRKENNLRFYMVGFMIILILTVIATAYGIIEKDTNGTCSSDSSELVILIGTAIFTLLDVMFFVLIAKKLRNTFLLSAEQMARRRRNENANRNNANNNSPSRNAASSPNRADRNRSQQVPQQQGGGRSQSRSNGQSRSNRSNNRGDRYRNDAPLRV